MAGGQSFEAGPGAGNLRREICAGFALGELPEKNFARKVCAGILDKLAAPINGRAEIDVGAARVTQRREGVAGMGADCDWDVTSVAMTSKRVGGATWSKRSARWANLMMINGVAARLTVTVCRLTVDKFFIK